MTTPVEPISIALCGAGGYAANYVEPLLEELAEGRARLAGVIEPHPECCPHWERLRGLGIPLHAGLEEFFAVSRCDLLIVASPMHAHAEQTCLALANGAHVLCEKPLCNTLEQIELMRAAEQAAGKTVTLGYQWSFTPAVQALKADYLAGRLGRALRFRTLVCWPRGDRYYRRNAWAGRQWLDSGELLLDSPVSNAAAHFLHHMLYILGPSAHESAEPAGVRAELWRAHRIENYDTAVLRVATVNGVDLHFVASHATQSSDGPAFTFEFEAATVEFRDPAQGIVARFHEGTTVAYGAPDSEPEPLTKLRAAMHSARTGTRPLCGITAAAPHIRCVHLAQAAPEGIRDFPETRVRVDTSGAQPRRYVHGLGEILRRCHREGGALAPELEALWSRETRAA
jgi:predicted dehydrogenase